MKKLGTRLGSLALAFAMLLSLLPVSAQAADASQTVVQPEQKTVTAQLQAAHLVEDTWENTNALTAADGVYTFQDTAEDVYESVGSTNFQSETETWEGDTTIETEVYIDPAQFETGEGFTMVCDILPTWRAFVVSIRKLESGEMLVDFSNNSSYAISENPANNQMKISEAGWYPCRWELFDQDGQVAGEFYLNNTQVGTTRTNAADTIATSYFRKFWIPTYGPQPIGGGQTENKEICAGKSVQFKDVTKTVDLPTWNVSSTEELATAIAEAKSGDTICLAAGEYSLADLVKSRTTGASTLIIDKSINLVGAVDENNNPATVFKGNNNSNDDAINVVGGVDVTIENIYFTEFGGNMTNNNVILAGSATQAFTGTLNVKNCNIDKFGKNGITVKGGTANITNVNIDVNGTAANRAPNGIQIDMNAVAAIDQTTVRNSASSSEDWSATGILTLRGGNTTASNVTLENCEQAFAVTGLYDGEQYKAAHASISNSKFLNCDTAVSNDTANDINASNNYWGEGDAITNIANQTSGNVTVDTYYADEAMQESVALEGTPVANVEQLREAIANAADGDVIFLAAGEYVLDENECFVLDKKLVIRGSGEDTIIKATNSKDYNNGVFTFAGGSEGSVLRDMTISYQSTGAQGAAVYFNGTFTGGSEEKLTQIYNVDFIGGESLETIGSEIAISSTYSTGGAIGYIDIHDCSFTNFAYGMYFNRLSNSTITGCVINGTKYNAINIAADGTEENSASENVSISSNIMTNISYANYEDEAYSCGIRVGLAASDVVLDSNDIEMLNDKTPVYIDEPAEGSDRIMVTYKDGETTIRTQLATANEEIVLPEALKKAGYIFAGWNNGKETYEAGASVKVAEDTTFTAVWNKLPFTDVTADDWFAEAVTYVYENGLMHGVSDTQFAPNSTLSRAMLVKMLYNLEEQNTQNSASDLFTDVEDGVWYTDAINWAASNQIVSGYPDHTFKPNNAISRQEMMAILYRYAKYKNYDVSATGDLSVFEDADTVANWAKDEVSWTVGAGLIVGMGNHTLAPNGTATRAEGAQLFKQFNETTVK